MSNDNVIPLFPVPYAVIAVYKGKDYVGDITCSSPSQVEMYERALWSVQSITSLVITYPSPPIDRLMRDAFRAMASQPWEVQS